jgi:hypothetical protein
MAQCLYFCLSFPGYKLHIYYALLHRNMRPVWLYHTFPHYLKKISQYGVKIIENKMCFLFFCKLVWNISHSRRIQSDIIITVQGSSSTVTVILVWFELNLKFCCQIFEKSSDVIYRGNPSRGSRTAPCGQLAERTDRHTEKQKAALRNFRTCQDRT